MMTSDVTKRCWAFEEDDWTWTGDEDCVLESESTATDAFAWLGQYVALSLGR